MAKIVTKKSDIPKYAQKAIKNFSKLTKNQAIFEYELIKLKRRARRISQNGDKVFENIIRPRTVYKEDIKQLTNIRGKNLRDIVEGTLGGGYADEYELAKEFFDRVISEIQNQSAQAHVTYSSYKSGRSRSAKSRQWVSDNIERGTNKLINLINSRRINEEAELAFYKSLKANGLNQLQDAISEYIAGLYYQTAETLTGYMQASRVYQIISDVPISMADARDFDNSGDNSEEEEIDEE